MKVSRRYSFSDERRFEVFTCLVSYETCRFWFTYRVDKDTKMIYEDSRQCDGTANLPLFAYELGRFANFIREYPNNRLRKSKCEVLGSDAYDEFSSEELFDLF